MLQRTIIAFFDWVKYKPFLIDIFWNQVEPGAIHVQPLRGISILIFFMIDFVLHSIGKRYNNIVPLFPIPISLWLIYGVIISWYCFLSDIR